MKQTVEIPLDPGGAQHETLLALKEPNSKVGKTSVKFLLRLVLSLFISFHLFCLVLYPNHDSELGANSRWFLDPYTNFLGLAVTWNYFAPNPAANPLFVEWELLDNKGELIRKGQIPDEQESFTLSERTNRRVYFVYYLLAAESRTEQVLLPYLCGKFPDTNSIRFWSVVKAVPKINEVSEGRRSLSDVSQSERKAISHSFCKRIRP